ncbi:hypothetical protein [Haloplanus pelagicus]|jgi:hypothetical protein|uniref:hypothetical protein n=1 Tax=Haloplanus pelagicus TaxID=2949995 RepID=UPI00203DC0D4|nr:hypothetical protein [Haloplanus sp. HW8-1]
MSHESDPTRLRGEGRSTPEGPAPKRLLGRLESHLAEWPRRYVDMQVEALDPKQ